MKFRTKIVFNILLVCMVFIPTISNAQIISGSGEFGNKDSDIAFLASYRSPMGLVKLDSGEILVVDTYNNVIRSIKDNKTSVYAGVTQGKDQFWLQVGGLKDGYVKEALFNRPNDIVVNSKGEIFITDTMNHCIRKIADGKVTTYAGTCNVGFVDEINQKAQFNQPRGITIDNEDNLYIADSLNNAIRKIDLEGNVSTLVGLGEDEYGYKDGNVETAVLNEPHDLVYDKLFNKLYIADTGNHVIRVLENNQILLVAGDKPVYLEGEVYATEGMFNFPMGIALDGYKILVADTSNNEIKEIENGEITSSYDVELSSPRSLFSTPTAIFISNTGSNQIIKETKLGLADWAIA